MPLIIKVAPNNQELHTLYYPENCVMARTIAKQALYLWAAGMLHKKAGRPRVHEDRKSLTGRAHCGPRIWAPHIFIPRPTTLRRLYIFAHECGHCFHQHSGSTSARRRECEATVWGLDQMRALDIEPALASIEDSEEYLAWKIKQAVRRKALAIHPPAWEYCRVTMMEKYPKAARIVRDLLAP